MKNSIHILLVDDHSLVREGFEALLRLDKNIRKITHAASASEALAGVRTEQPDIVLLDRRMPDGDGFDLLGELRRLAPLTRVIMMTATATIQDVETARSLGAAGFLSKNVRRAALVTAIRTVLDGGQCFDQAILTLLPATGTKLSPRELQVLEKLPRGLNNVEIAKALGISENTVKSHLKVIFDKLGASGRAEAVSRGFELSLLRL